MLEGRAENCVLAEKSSEGRNSGDGQRGDEKCSRGGGNFVPESAHLAHVLLAGHGVNHAAGAEEEERFEKCMRHQVENTSGECADAESEEHVAELADGGIGEDALDVILYERHCCRENCGRWPRRRRR